MGKLSETEIQEKLTKLEGWVFLENKISKKYKFKNFRGAMVFVSKVGELAEAANHHPDVEFGWGYATISLTTHDDGGVSEKDFKLAAEIASLTP